VAHAARRELLKMRLTTRELIEHAKRTIADREQQQLANMRREIYAAMLRVTARAHTRATTLSAEVFWFYDVPQRLRDVGLQHSFRDVAHAFWDHLELLVRRDELIVALAAADPRQVDLSSFGRALQTFAPLQRMEREWSADPSDERVRARRDSRSCWLYRHLGPAPTWEAEGARSCGVSCEDYAAYELFRGPFSGDELRGEQHDETRPGRDEGGS
jgi:hypothetical protein